MTVETRRPPYAGWRAAAATLLVLPGAVGAHTWAGGHVPDWPMLLLLAVVLYAGSLAFLRGRLSAKALLPALALAQAGLHAAFVATTTAGGEAQMATGMGGMGGPGGPGGTGGTDLATHAHHAAGSPWAGRMLLAHLLVTLLTAVAWHWCARAAVTLVHLLRWPASYAVGRRPGSAPAPAPAPPRSTHQVVAPRRGPPASAPAT